MILEYFKYFYMRHTNFLTLWSEKAHIFDYINTKNFYLSRLYKKFKKPRVKKMIVVAAHIIYEGQVSGT